MDAATDAVVEQLCRTRLFELFPELPGREVEECYMRCGGVLRITYQMLLERIPAASAAATTAAGGRSSSRSVGDDDDDAGVPPEPPRPPAEIEEQLAALAAERARTEEATRATTAAAELAAEQLARHEARIAEAEAACEAAERAAAADSLRREAVAEQLSAVLGRVQSLESDFHQRVQAAKAAALAQHAAEQECAVAAAADAAAAADDEDAAAEATAKADHHRWSQRVAVLEASVVSNREALDSAAARRRDAEGVEHRARAEEAELQKSIRNMQLQQEHDELEQAERAAQEKREMEERERLENETDLLTARLGNVERDLVQLRTGAAASAIQSQNPQSKPKSAAEVGGTSTDPNGIEPRIGEDEVSYVARQQRLAAEAKERMVAKFGNKAEGPKASASPPAPAPAPGRSGRTSPRLPPCSGILQVNVVAASYILAADPSGKSDPFVKLVLGPCARTTAVVPKTLNPVFNETITLPVIVDESAQGSDAFLLCVEVWDHDRHSRDDFLGECSVHLLDLFNGRLWTGERRIHYAFGDPRGRLGARERKQVKHRAGENPYGTVDLSFTFVPDGATPSLSTWMAERQLSDFIPRIEEAMIRAEVPDDEVLHLLAGMDDDELKEFIEACDATRSGSTETQGGTPDDTAPSLPPPPPTTPTQTPQLEVEVQGHEHEHAEEANEVKELESLDIFINDDDDGDGDGDDVTAVHVLVDLVNEDADEDEDDELVEISSAAAAANPSDSGSVPAPMVVAVEEAGLLQMQIGGFEEDDDISDDDYIDDGGLQIHYDGFAGEDD